MPAYFPILHPDETRKNESYIRISGAYVRGQECFFESYSAGLIGCANNVLQSTDGDIFCAVHIDENGTPSGAIWFPKAGPTSCDRFGNDIVVPDGGEVTTFDNYLSAYRDALSFMTARAETISAKELSGAGELPEKHAKSERNARNKARERLAAMRL